MLVSAVNKNPRKEVSSLKKIIIILQWLTTFVSNMMNRIFLSPEVSGMENLFELVDLKEKNDLGIVFISNHLNCNDPFVQTAFLPVQLKKKIFPITFLATHEKFGGKIKTFIMQLLGCIPVGNEKGQNVREAIKRIKAGETIYLFPEGMISLTGGMNKDVGALQFFSKFSDIIIQPLRVGGLKSYWDLKDMFLMRQKLRIAFGKPFVLKKGSNINAVEIIANIAF